MTVWIRRGLSIVLGCLIWGIALGVEAAPQGVDCLTLDDLQDRIEHPVQREGRSTIDLRQVILDLRPENSDFRDRFYRLLQPALQGGNTALSLDLSHATVRGELDLRRLSLREPLYGEAFFSLLPEVVQAQLQRDRQRLSQLNQLSRSLLIQPQSATPGIFLFRGSLNLSQSQFEGPVVASDIFFLENITGQGAEFLQAVNFSQSRFNQAVILVGGIFQQAAQFRSCLFLGRLRLNQAIFRGGVTFQGSEFFQAAGFQRAQFVQVTNFSRTMFQDTADFGQTQWQDNGSFAKSSFAQAVFLAEATFAAPMSFRQMRLAQSMNLRGAVTQSQLDFGDATFLENAYINVSGLDFNSDQAVLLGSPGKIGRALSVPTLEGNEALLRNLVRNFRKLEQVVDANQVEYTLERLRLQALQQRLTAVNLNTATGERLIALGFSSAQSDALLQRRQRTPFVKAADILDVEGIDLATYVKLRDRIMAQPPLSWPKRLQLALGYLTLELLLLTSNYGTSVGLVLGVGVLAIALSSLLIWGVDRYRRWHPTPIVAPPGEVLWMAGSFVLLLLLGSTMVVRLGHGAVLTVGAIILIVLPIPGGLTVLLYRQGRFHSQLETSYLVEDGSARQLRLLIARLPIIPKFPFFRERYTAIDWQRRRCWLNYYDFSLNNWFKFGFNDIRLRDEWVPGLVTAIVWYQWAVGLAYVTLLLWTLSRTIPGLNLLIYF